MIVIKNVIFDCGNVLNRWQPISYFMSIGYSKEICEQMVKKMFGSEDWFLYDKGMYSFEETIAHIIAKYPNDEELIVRFAREWLQLLEPIPAHQQLMKDLREQGYRIYILSNIAPESWKKVCELSDYETICDGRVLSYEEHHCKPEAEIYETLLNRYHLKGEECLFLDDLQTNLDQAKQFGVVGLRVTSENMNDVVYRVLKEYQL